MDVVVSAQLQQWTFEKPQADRPDLSASSPDPFSNDTETLRLDSAEIDAATDLDSKETLSLQERYLSSEEDLSPMEGHSESDSEFDDDDNISIHDFEKECFHARKMSISRFEKGKSCDMAVMVSYVSAGRPKMIDLANLGSPTRESTKRSASLAQLPIAAISKLRTVDQASRLSLEVSSSTSRSTSPAFSSEVQETRRPSTGHLPFSHNNSSLQISDSSSSFTNLSTRSSSPSVSEKFVRPISVATHRPQPPSSLHLSTTASSSPTVPFPPLTPQSPDVPSFLSSDPYENSTTTSASPIIKSGPHKRLRSISQKLSLAKIAITPSTKKWDSRINGKSGQMPPTPRTPLTPLTAPITFSPPKIRLRRNSKPSRPNSMRGPSPDVPPIPTAYQDAQAQKPAQRLQARGANEREPILELPPCPDEIASDGDPAGSLKAKRVRKRKSLLDLL